MRIAPPTWKAVVAAAVALAACVQLALAAGSHGEAHHAEGGHDHACVVCVFTHVQEAGPAVLGELVSPHTGEAERPVGEPAPHIPTVVVLHPARGPPTLRA